ncbi:DoxX family protein [Devosia honganensis]|uniref:DoxX family protein n=1 Tax=Devosia honganensis TaxID=1610527 RepID=A0ABV7WXV0_9HYPH
MVARIVYWVSTLAFCAFYALSIYTYISDPAGSAAGYAAVGYPAYLVSLMIFVKIAGILAVLVRRPLGLAQLAYAGFFYHLILAFSAHVTSGVPGFEISVVLFVLVILSWLSQNAARGPGAAYVPNWFDRWA